MTVDLFPEIDQNCDDCSWLAIKSPKELFQILISRGFISAALPVKDLDCCQNLIDTEAMVMSILQINATVDPHIYINWVTDVLIQMNLSDPHISIILNWAHRMADELDETDNRGIDASLLLLSVSGIIFV